MSEQKIKRLMDAGCENVYPKFIFGSGEDRYIAAEIMADELVVTAKGEVLLAAQVKQTTPKKKEATGVDTPAVEVSVETAPTVEG